MAWYKIVHKEELVDEFFVEADSGEEALEEFNHQVQNGEIDFSGAEMVDSSDTAILEGESL